MRKNKEHKKEIPVENCILYIYLNKSFYAHKTQFLQESVMTLSFDRLNCCSHQFRNKLKRYVIVKIVCSFISAYSNEYLLSESSFYDCFLLFATFPNPKCTSI